MVGTTLADAGACGGWGDPARTCGRAPGRACAGHGSCLDCATCGRGVHGCSCNSSAPSRSLDKPRTGVLSSVPCCNATRPRPTSATRPTARRRLSSSSLLPHPQVRDEPARNQKQDARFAKPRTERRGVFCWPSHSPEIISRNKSFTAHSTPFDRSIPTTQPHRTTP